MNSSGKGTSLYLKGFGLRRTNKVTKRLKQLINLSIIVITKSYKRFYCTGKTDTLGEVYVNIEGAFTNKELHHTFNTVSAARRQARQIDVVVKV